MPTGNEFDTWHRLLAGEKAPLHLDEPICGYFRMRDKRGLNANLYVTKRPWIPCAIWRDEAGELKAELAGSQIPVDRLWPFCAKTPISYEAYAFFHSHERWPEEAKAA